MIQSNINGVGILRFPDGSEEIRKILRKMASEIRVGSIIGLPSTRDSNGNYLYDFTIVGGDFDQVKVEMLGTSVPIIVGFEADAPNIIEKDKS